MLVFVRNDFPQKKNRVRTLVQGSLLKLLVLFITVYIQVMLDRNLIIIKMCKRAGIKLLGTQWYFQENKIIETWASLNSMNHQIDHDFQVH